MPSSNFDPYWTKTWIFEQYLRFVAFTLAALELGEVKINQQTLTLNAGRYSQLTEVVSDHVHQYSG